MRWGDARERRGLARKIGRGGGGDTPRYPPPFQKSKTFLTSRIQTASLNSLQPFQWLKIYLQTWIRDTVHSTTGKSTVDSVHMYLIQLHNKTFFYGFIYCVWENVLGPTARLELQLQRQPIKFQILPYIESSLYHYHCYYYCSTSTLSFQGLFLLLILHGYAPLPPLLLFRDENLRPPFLSSSSCSLWSRIISTLWLLLPFFGAGGEKKEQGNPTSHFCLDTILFVLRNRVPSKSFNAHTKIICFNKGVFRLQYIVI